MLNKLWGGMILAGMLFAFFTGRAADVTNQALESAKDAVTLCITMLGILSMWSGLMKIAERAGLVQALSQKAMPLLRRLFPDIPPGHKAMEYIATNFIANILGLGWAATPAGLKAMEELQGLNHGRDRASNAMCMFMIINMSSLQLVTMNVIAFRSQYGSANPSEIILPGILATMCAAVVGVGSGKLMERRSRT